MKVYKLENQEIKGLYVLKANLYTKDELINYLDSLRLKFIDACKTNEDWSSAYLTNENQSIIGDIFNEVDLPDGHLMFYVLSNRFAQFPDLEKEVLHIIGKTHRFENWAD